MNESVKQRHTARAEQNRLDDGHHEVDRVQNLRAVAQFAGNFAAGRAGDLGAHQVHGTAIGHGQHGHGKDQHAHAADPVGKAAPEQRAVAQRLDVGQNCRACRRKARDRLKKSIDKGRYLAGDDKRQCAENRHQHPDKRHDGQAVAGVDFRVLGGAQAGYQAQRQHDQRRPQEGKHNAPLAVDGGAAHGKEHEGCFDQEDAPQHKPYHFIVHGCVLTLQCRAASAALCRW